MQPGINDLTCLPKHGGVRDNKIFGHPSNDRPTLLNFRDLAEAHRPRGHRSSSNRKKSMIASNTNTSVPVKRIFAFVIWHLIWNITKFFHEVQVQYHFFYNSTSLRFDNTHMTMLHDMTSLTLCFGRSAKLLNSAAFAVVSTHNCIINVPTVGA
jgi:hypothetical protein